MAYHTKRKKNTTITFSSTSGGSTSANSTTTGVLREKTTIHQDGGDTSRALDRGGSWRVDCGPPGCPQEYTAGDHGGDDSDDKEGGARPSRVVGGRPPAIPSSLRCSDTRAVGTTSHSRRVLDVPKVKAIIGAIFAWQAASCCYFFERRTLKDMGLRIQLGHWHSSDHVCPLPQAAPGDDFVIVDSTGVHPVHLDFCIAASLCTSLAGDNHESENGRDVLSFATIVIYSRLSPILVRESDNLHYKKDKDRYHEFPADDETVAATSRCSRGRAEGMRMAGVTSTKPGGVTENTNGTRFLYALFVAIDANFRLARKDVSSETKDPGLGNGLAFYGDVLAYMGHVRKHWNQMQDRSHCVAHDTVDKPDREARGKASSGIGAVDCARHNMKRLTAVGDLQLGERYLNMDYMFFYSLAGSELLRYFVSYDITCQWWLNLWKRMLQYQDETLMLDGHGKSFTFLVPKFHLPAHIEACNLKYSFNLTPYVGQTDGEAPERGWADANPLARSTKEMGPGFCRDTLDDHFNDWNHKKIIALGHTIRRNGARQRCQNSVMEKMVLPHLEISCGPPLFTVFCVHRITKQNSIVVPPIGRYWQYEIALPSTSRKVQNAVTEMSHAWQALADMNKSLGADEVKIWRIMVEKWEADIEAPNPFETIQKDQHVASVRAELAAEAAAREAAGAEEADTVRGDMRVTELIAMGLQLEEQQRVLASDVAATGLHPTDGQRRAMIERTSKLRRKIFAWIDIQQKFFLALANIRAREHEAHARATNGQPIPGVTASNIELCLPSAMAAAPAADKAELKDDYSRGVRANIRSGDRIAALNHQIKRAAGGYRVARKALVALGQELGRNEWERTLLPLAEEDVRGLPRATFHDPDQKKKKKKQKRRKTSRKEPLKMSWIWVAQGESWKPGDDAAMNEAIRIEWAKTRARANRWAEEVDLLEEEMRCVNAFLQWRSGWWKERVGLRGLPDGPQREGETAYAIRQSAVQATLAAEFATEWDSLKELIRRGRAGELSDEGEEGEQSDEEREGAGDDSGEEEEPIPLLPARTVNPIDVDEVLTM
ncbi:hypothetical protein B0H14DRAFT_2615098 [Mycena olivaceomarginata]|nr:hypothetical protein B0H14DRAFT_2615098 [Mycena olivaceomarginata]